MKSDEDMIYIMSSDNKRIIAQILIRNPPSVDFLNAEMIIGNNENLIEKINSILEKVEDIELKKQIIELLQS